MQTKLIQTGKDLPSDPHLFGSNYWSTTTYKKHFYIEADGQRILFKPNTAQKIIKKLKIMYPYMVLLKGRQFGMTTDEKLDDLDWIMSKRYQKCLTIAHTTDDAKKIFAKAKFAFDQLPEDIRSQYLLKLDRQDKLEFENRNSSLEVDTSGRSGTYDRVHISEFAKMLPKTANEVITGTFPAMFKNKNSHGFVEFTANGMNHAKVLWDEACHPFTKWQPVFLCWTIMPDYAEPIPAHFNLNLEQEYHRLAKIYNLQENIVERYGLTMEQLYWYYLQVLQYKEEVKAEFPFTPEEAFMNTGNMVFSEYDLQQLPYSDAVNTLLGGDCLIWKLPDPTHDYIIGADCSEGNINSDFACAGILDVQTGEQVAELHGRWIDHVYAKHLATLGRMYNNALLAVERNNHGHSVINSLKNAENYTNLYDGEDNKTGWLTTGKSKPDMINGADGLNKAIEEKWIITNSLGFISECRIFEYKTTAKTSMGAQDGKENFDDRVMAWAIAWYLRNHARVARDSSGNKRMVG